MDYHAHIYYDLKEKNSAENIRNSIIKEFPKLSVYNLVDREIGPHLKPMFEVEFSDQELSSIKGWLEENRNNHSVLIHKLIDDQLLAHTTEAIWLGKELDLNIGKL